MGRNVEKITSRSNSVCVHLKKLGKNKSYRDEQKQFLCDGFKLLCEAADSGVKINTVISSRLLDFDFLENARVFHADESLIDSISPLKNSQGLLFSCRKPDDNFDYSPGTHILLDGIQDPSNVGAIIRSSLAFGIRSVMLMDTTADVYNPKAVRASMGAVFKQRIRGIKLNNLSALKRTGVRVVGTANDGNSKSIKKASVKDSIIVLGSEGHGITREIQDLCDEMVKIPLESNCESLNVAVAASIIMWEAYRRY